MSLVPEGLFPLVAFALTVGGTAFIVASPRVPKAYSLGLLTLAVFFVQSFTEFGQVTFALALVTEPFLSGETWWTPLTYMFVHAGFLHIFGNLFILVTAGPPLEERVGPYWFLVVYFAAGFAAAGAHLVLTTYGVVANAPAVGASGAIFGILTAFAVRYPREQLPMILGFFVIRLPAFLVLLIHLGLNLAIMLRETNVAWYGHFAGYLVGLAAAVYFEKRKVEIPVGSVVVGSRQPMPDVARLRPLATTPQMNEMLDKAAKFTGEDANDAEFANAWVDRFLERARCPHHAAPLTRHGTQAYCPHGDYTVDFAAKN